MKFWEYAPPNFKLISDLEKKKRKLLPFPLSPYDELDLEAQRDQQEPDFAAEEQAGLTALARTPKPFPGQNASIRPLLPGQNATMSPIERRLPPAGVENNVTYGEQPGEFDPTFWDKVGKGAQEIMTGAIRAGETFAPVPTRLGLQGLEKAAPVFESPEFQAASMYPAFAPTRGFGQAAVAAARAGRMVLPGAAAKGAGAAGKTAKRVAELSAADQRGGIKLPEGMGKGKTPKPVYKVGDVVQVGEDTKPYTILQDMDKDTFVGRQGEGPIVAFDKRDVKPLPGQAPLAQAAKAQGGGQIVPPAAAERTAANVAPEAAAKGEGGFVSPSPTGSVGQAVKEGLKSAKVLNQELYVFPTAEGMKIGKQPPSFGIQHIIVKPDGSHQVVSAGSGFESARQLGVEPSPPAKVVSGKPILNETAPPPEPVSPQRVAQGEAAIPPKITAPIEQQAAPIRQEIPVQTAAGVTPPVKPPVVTGRPDIDDKYQRVAAWLKDPERIESRKELEQAWKAEKGRRFARYQELNQSYLNEGATPQEAQRLAKSAMKGKYGDPDAVMSDEISNIFAEVLFERNNILNANDAGLHLSTAEAIRNAMFRPIHFRAGISETGKVELSALDKLLRLVEDVPELKELVGAAAKSRNSINAKIQEKLIGSGKSGPWKDFDVPPSGPHAQYTLEGKEASFIKKEQAKPIPELSIGEKANIERMVSTHELPFGKGTDLGATIKPLEGKPGELGSTWAERKAVEKAAYDRYLATIKPAPQMTPEAIAAAKKALAEWQEETRKLNTIIDQQELVPVKPMDIWLKENPGKNKGDFFENVKQQFAKQAQERAESLRLQQDALDKASQYLKDLTDDTMKQLDLGMPNPNNPLWKRALKETGLTIRDVGNLMRGLKAFLDNSWPNQQRLLLFKSANADWLAMRDSLKAWKNPAYEQEVWNEIIHSPEMALYDKLGLDFLRPLKLRKWQKGYEGIEEFGFTQSQRPIAKFTEKIPLMQRSQAAFAAGTNRNNFEIFKQYVRKVNKINEEIAMGKRKLKPGEAFDTMKAVKDLGTMIEHMTGRAQLGPLKSLSPVLNNGFFAIRNTLGKGLLAKDLFNPNPIVQKEAWKLFASMAGSINAVALGGAKMGLWEYDTDPRSATTGQIKIGHSYYNPWGPWSSMLRLTARIATGEGVSAQGNVYKVKPWEELGRYARGKEAPGASLVTDILTKSTYLGNKPKWLSTRQWADRLAPMITTNAYDAFSIEDPTQASINTVMSFFGMYTSTYLTDDEKQQAIGEKSGIVKGRAWEEVTASEKTAIRNLPESQELLESKADSDYKKEQSATFTDYNNALDRDEWVKQGMRPNPEDPNNPLPYSRKQWRNDIELQAFARQVQADYKKKTGKLLDQDRDRLKPLDQVRYDYYDLMGKLRDPQRPDAWLPNAGDKIDAFMNKLTIEQQEHIEQNEHPSATPEQRQFFQDRKKMKPYWDTLNEYKKRYNEQYNTNVDFYLNQIQILKNQGDVQGARMREANPYVRGYIASEERLKKIIRIQSPELEQLMVKYGYWTVYKNPENIQRQRELAGVK